MDLRAQLQDHLGDAFRIERELGGGGMSRVFVATEVRLSRQVVIKVLSPELVQGINAERFEREILLAASLQQANIVGVLTAGEVGGLPYFTMPFVDGESLRNRIGHGMPIDDVIAILRDVAKALAYAHQRGIVHRDIKPDNVLLSGGTAVVTDFGIAKALSASRTDGGQNATLTSVGTSIGTPAYMAPEQVAGDPNLDHRVDLYALGCMAFELLTGKSPFADYPPQRMLAAHLSEAPKSVETLRPDCPPALALLVARLLEKDPADRLGSAQEVVQALGSVATTSSESARLTPQGRMVRSLALWALSTLVVWIVARAAVVGIGLPSWTVMGAVGVMLLGLPVLLVTGWAKWMARKAAAATPTLTPGGGMAPRPPSGTMANIAIKANRHLSFRRATRGGMIAMGAFVVLIAAFMITRAMGVGPAASLFAAGSLNAQDKVLLASFSAAPEDSALAPIVQEAVRAAMSQSRAVQVLEPGDVADALTQMRRPTTTPVAGVVAQEVAQRTGAAAILRGRLARAGSGYAVSLELASVKGGAILTSMQGSAGDASDLIPEVDALTRKLRSKIGESLRDVARTVPLEQATTSNLEALRLYTEAVRANDIDQDYDRAIRTAREAVALDSTFALAWRKLGVALFNNRASQLAQDSAFDQAARYAGKLPERERLMVMGGLYDSHSTRANRDSSLMVYRALYRLDSTSTVATNQLARAFGSRGDSDSALRYMRRQYALEPVPSNHSRISFALLLDGDLPAAAAVLDSVRQEDSTGAASYAIERNQLLLDYARGDWSSARAVADSLTAMEMFRAKRDGLSGAADLELLAGRLSRYAALTTRSAALDSSRGVAGFDSVYIAGMEAIYRDRPAAAAALLDRVLTSREWRESPAVDRPWLNVVTFYALAGRPDRARAVLADYRTALPGAEQVELNANLVAAAEGEIMLAEGNTAAAIAKFRRTLTARDGGRPPCETCGMLGLGKAFDKAGQADSAITWYQRYLAVPAARRFFFFVDAQNLARIRKRLGELYEQKGERQQALEQYTALVDQWRDADPELQPTVRTIKQRIAELQRKEGT